MDPNFCMPPAQQYLTGTAALGGGPGTSTSSDDFAVRNTDCHYPSQESSFFGGFPNTCTFEAVFAPTQSGARSRILSFPDNGGPTAAVTLRGSGLATMPVLPAPTRPKCKHKKKHTRAAAAKKKKCKKKR
jgi:hypothetical protein